MRSPVLELIITIILLVSWPDPGSAQSASTDGEQSPAVVAAGSVAISYGFSAEQVRELTEAAATGATGPLADRIVDLSNRLGVTQGAVLAMLRVLGEQAVPVEDLPAKLVEVATAYREARDRLAALEPKDPAAQLLVSRAQGDIDAGNLQSADEFLEQAEKLEVASAQKAQRLLQEAQSAVRQKLLRAAKARASRGAIAMASLKYDQAASHYLAAADMTPTEERSTIANFLNDAAYAQYIHWGMSRNQSDGDKLLAILNKSLFYSSQYTDPWEWAYTNYLLAEATADLNILPSDIVGAIAYYNNSLQIYEQRTTPREWARSQRGISDVMIRLCVSEKDLSQCSGAIDRLLSVLAQFKFDDDPLNWGWIHHTIAVSYANMGRISGDIRYWDKALEHYSISLRGWSKDRSLQQWVRGKIAIAEALCNSASFASPKEQSAQAKNRLFASLLAFDTALSNVDESNNEYRIQDIMTWRRRCERKYNLTILRDRYHPIN